MQFYRVCHRTHQDPKGYHVGPYNGRHQTPLTKYQRRNLNRMTFDHGDDGARPPYADDLRLGLREGLEYVCGFTDPDQLRWWFDGWLVALHRSNYVARVFEVPEDSVVSSRCQAACPWEVLVGSPAVQFYDLTTTGRGFLVEIGL